MIEDQEGLDVMYTLYPQTKSGIGVNTRQCMDEVVKSKSRRKKNEERREEYRPPPLPEPLQTWRKLLKDIWIGEEEKSIKHELCQSIMNNVFDECEHPLKTVLVLHKVCPDFGVQKTSSLACFVLRHFQSWLRKTERFEEVYSKLDRTIKIEAFTVATCKHTVNLELIGNIFRLRTDDMAEYVLQAVEGMVRVANYRDAITCATYFSLQSHFTLNDLIIPCMLQDRYLAVEEFIKNEKKMQEELVRYFDNLIGLDERAIDRYFEDFRARKIMTIPTSKLQRKALEKLVSKLLSTYNLVPQEVAPNLTRSRREGALRHMVFMHFVEHGVTEEGYFDYVAHALESDIALQKYFVNYLCSSGRYEDALLWVVHCNMFDYAPRCVHPYLNSASLRKAESNLARFMSERPSIARMELFQGHPIRMVATAEDVKKLYPVIENADLIGIDTEWKPLFMCTNEQVALFQICVRDASYLIDVITLENELTQEQWIRFFKILFCDSAAIKLGFDLLNDLRVLRATFPFLQPLEEMRRVICILKLVNSLLASNPTFLDLSHIASPSTSNENENSSDLSSSDISVHFRLTDLCKVVLGEPLDKREQIGNWAMRPLRYDQMKYAAMDGYCLLQLYDRLKEKAERECNLDWTIYLMEGDVTHVKPKGEKRTKKKGKFDDEEFNQMIERVNADIKISLKKQKPKELKIIVDSMMLGLGKHLRRCGIDTILAETRSFLIECAEKDPERYILTSGKAVDELRKHRSLRAAERILCIPAAQCMTMIQQIEFVLRQFNIHLSKEDIFSRCMNCNSDLFVIAPSPVLEAMYRANVAALNPFSEEIYDATKYAEKIMHVDAQLYSGYGCTLELSQSNRTWSIAHCYNGILDIENCLVMVLNHSAAVEVKIEKVPLPVLEKEGRFFYVCGECGRVYWDGCHISNYNVFVDSLFGHNRAHIKIWEQFRPASHSFQAIFQSYDSHDCCTV